MSKSTIADAKDVFMSRQRQVQKKPLPHMERSSDESLACKWQRTENARAAQKLIGRETDFSSDDDSQGRYDVQDDEYALKQRLANIKPASRLSSPPIARYSTGQSSGISPLLNGMRVDRNNQDTIAGFSYEGEWSMDELAIFNATKPLIKYGSKGYIPGMETEAVARLSEGRVIMIYPFHHCIICCIGKGSMQFNGTTYRRVHIIATERGTLDNADHDCTLGWVDILAHTMAVDGSAMTEILARTDSNGQPHVVLEPGVTFRTRTSPRSTDQHWMINGSFSTFLIADRSNIVAGHIQLPSRSSTQHTTFSRSNSNQQSPVGRPSRATNSDAALPSWPARSSALSSPSGRPYDDRDEGDSNDYHDGSRLNLMPKASLLGPNVADWMPPLVNSFAVSDNAARIHLSKSFSSVVNRVMNECNTAISRSDFINFVKDPCITKIEEWSRLSDLDKTMDGQSQYMLQQLASMSTGSEKEKVAASLIAKEAGVALLAGQTLAWYDVFHKWVWIIAMLLDVSNTTLHLEMIDSIERLVDYLKTIFLGHSAAIKAESLRSAAVYWSKHLVYVLNSVGHHGMVATNQAIASLVPDLSASSELKRLAMYNLSNQRPFTTDSTPAAATNVAKKAASKKLSQPSVAGSAASAKPVTIKTLICFLNASDKGCPHSAIACRYSHELPRDKPSLQVLSDNVRLHNLKRSAAMASNCKAVGL
jgi:hypothetical protein